MVTAESLEQAGLRLRQADFILLVCCVGVTAGLVGFILGGVGLGLLFLVLTPFGAMLFLKILTNRRRAKFADQLGDTLQILAGGLRAGHSLLAVRRRRRPGGGVADVGGIRPAGQ